MSFSFVQITDHHLTGSEGALVHGFSTWPSFRAVMRQIPSEAGGKIDFIVSTGDLIDPAPDEAYRSYRAVLAALNADPSGVEAPGPLRISAEGLHDMPAYFLPGNHDDLDAMLRTFYPASRPMARMNVTFEHKGVRFICLDWGREPHASAAHGVLDHLESGLRDGKPAVILTHHAVAPVGVRWLDDFISPEAGRFWGIVRGGNVLAVLAGHVHVTSEVRVSGVPACTLRSTAFQFARTAEPARVLEPPHYRLVAIEHGEGRQGAGLTSRVYEVAL